MKRPESGPDAAILRGMEECTLAEELIRLDSSHPPGVTACVELIHGWLIARGVPVRREHLPGGREVLLAERGGGPRHLLLCGHLDVVPAEAELFQPSRDNGRLRGRGAYDMKGALAVMMLVIAGIPEPDPSAGVSLLIVPDEERTDLGEDAPVDDANCTEIMVERGLGANFVICGEPTDMDVGVQAKGVLMTRIVVPGTAAHGSTPWLGDNAILRAVDYYERVMNLPFASTSSELFSRPSVNLSRITGGEALNSVPGRCAIDVDIRYVPGQDPQEILGQIRGLDPRAEITVLLERRPADVPTDHPHVRALVAAADAASPGAEAVGRHGASDVGAFLGKGIPAVEFGPRGGGHHGAGEHVEIGSLSDYRRALESFATTWASGAGA